MYLDYLQLEQKGGLVESFHKNYQVKMETWWAGRLMVSTLVSRSSGLGSCPDPGTASLQDTTLDT